MKKRSVLLTLALSELPGFLSRFLSRFLTSLLVASVIPGASMASSQEDAGSSGALPIVSSAYFKPGQEYLWQYLENGQLYSTEKYKVLSSSPGKILIEMSTRMGHEEAFQTHHRLEVSLEKCLAAYANPGSLRPWKLTLFYWQKGTWNKVEGLNSTAAFEEKFNCNPHRQKPVGQKVVLNQFQTVLGASELFQFRYGPSEDKQSWYFLTGDRAAVLGFKRLSAPMAPLQYEIHFWQ